MVIWKLPIGMRLIFPFFRRWFPGSNVPPVSYRQLASMCVLYWKYGNTPYWVDIEPDLFWRTLPRSMKRQCLEDRKRNGSVTVLAQPPQGPIIEIHGSGQRGNLQTGSSFPPMPSRRRVEDERDHG
jgi:hypothetical protein